MKSDVHGHDSGLDAGVGSCSDSPMLNIGSLEPSVFEKVIDYASKAIHALKQHGRKTLLCTSAAAITIIGLACNPSHKPTVQQPELVPPNSYEETSHVPEPNDKVPGPRIRTKVIEYTHPGQQFDLGKYIDKAVRGIAEGCVDSAFGGKDKKD